MTDPSPVSLARALEQKIAAFYSGDPDGFWKQCGCCRAYVQLKIGGKPTGDLIKHGPHCPVDELSSLLALARPVEQEGWQPIETAPKEGLTEVLGNFDGLRRVMWWSPLEGWMTACGATRPAQPDHWMPLPVPPLVSRSTPPEA